jgi:Family of unknown function (DUF6459)
VAARCLTALLSRGARCDLCGGTMDDSPAAGGLRPGEVPPGPCQSPETGRPLPDLMAIHLADVPDAWPPYDDEVFAGPTAGPGAPFQAATSRAAEAHAGQAEHATGAAHPPGAAHTTAGTRAAGEPRASGEDERRERGSGDTDSDQWPSQFAQVLAETLAGSRPASQMTPWTTERARAHIRRLGPLLAAEQRPRVQRVLTSRPVKDVVEVSVIVGFGSRTRALAARLERAGPQAATLGRPARQARWLCTAVESA